MGKFVQNHSLEINEDSINLVPERALWIAVLCRAALDAFKGPPQLDLTLKSNRTHKNQATYDRDQARHFFSSGGSHFNEVCEMAGSNPRYVQDKARKLILKSNGWNVDVPITSHYRSRKRNSNRGPYKKKHLTGNAYYAMKAKQNAHKKFYYYEMGKKGGRPRMYNRIEQ